MSDIQEKSKQELARDRTEKAADRTDWAHERTLLAKERTFSAWGRTGLSAMAAGLAIAHLLGSTDHPWVARTIGVLMILTSGLIFVIGFISYRKALKKLAEKGIRGTSIWVIRLITAFLLLSTMLALILIFF
jgi:putative membrane protein